MPIMRQILSPKTSPNSKLILSSELCKLRHLMSGSKPMTGEPWSSKEAHSLASVNLAQDGLETTSPSMTIWATLSPASWCTTSSVFLSQVPTSAVSLETPMLSFALVGTKLAHSIHSLVIIIILIRFHRSHISGITIPCKVSITPTWSETQCKSNLHSFLTTTLRWACFIWKAVLFTDHCSLISLMIRMLMWIRLTMLCLEEAWRLLSRVLRMLPSPKLTITSQTVFGAVCSTSLLDVLRDRKLLSFHLESISHSPISGMAQLFHFRLVLLVSNRLSTKSTTFSKDQPSCIFIFRKTDQIVRLGVDS